MSLNERSQREILHGRQLATLGDPELIWNWATPAGQARAKRRAKLLAEAARPQPGMSVLEVGCGTGLFTEMLAAYGAHILAVDISPNCSPWHAAICHRWNSVRCASKTRRLMDSST